MSQVERSDVVLGVEKECVECKKKFFVQLTGSYTYKRKNGKKVSWYCCYTCFRKKIKEKEENANKRRASKNKPKKK